MRLPFIDVAKRALTKHYPDAVGAFVAGSMLRGEDTHTSDIDITVLFDDGFEDVHRNSVMEEGWPIEFFVHNQRAQDYYMDQDRERGMCIQSSMIATGIMVPEQQPDLLRQKKKAEAIIAAGPPRLSEADIDLRRYSLTDLADDLEGVKDEASRLAILASLHDRVGDFHLRAKGTWSGDGKSLVRILRANDPAYAQHFEGAFTASFRGENSVAVQKLIDQTLLPYGGRLWEGYRVAAPDTWRGFVE